MDYIIAAYAIATVCIALTVIVVVIAAELFFAAPKKPAKTKKREGQFKRKQNTRSNNG